MTVFDRDDAFTVAIVRNFRNTNYAVVDADLLDQLYRLLYQQRVTDSARIKLHPRNEITSVSAAPDGIEVAAVDSFGGRNHRCTYNAVILAPVTTEMRRTDSWDRSGATSKETGSIATTGWRRARRFVRRSISRAIPRHRTVSATHCCPLSPPLAGNCGVARADDVPTRAYRLGGAQASEGAMRCHCAADPRTDGTERTVGVGPASTMTSFGEAAKPSPAAFSNASLSVQ